MSYINLVHIDKKSYEIRRLKIQEETYEYLISTRARWEPVIAMKNVTLRAHNVHQIGIRPIRLNPNELVVPCPVEWNSLGQLISVGRLGTPKKVERARVFNHANFLAFRDGNIVEGDLLGVLNVFPQATILPILRSISREAPPPYRS